MGGSAVGSCHKILRRQRTCSCSPKNCHQHCHPCTVGSRHTILRRQRTCSCSPKNCQQHCHPCTVGSCHKIRRCQRHHCPLSRTGPNCRLPQRLRTHCAGSACGPAMS